MRFLYKNTLDDIQYKVNLSSVDNNLINRLNINMGIIENYYNNSDVFISNQNKIHRLFVNMYDSHVNGLNNVELSKFLSTHNDVDSKYSLSAEPNIEYPHITINFDLQQSIKVVDVGNNNIDSHLSLIHPTRLSLASYKIILNPNKIMEDIFDNNLSINDYINRVFYITMMKQSFLLSLLKSTLLGIEHIKVKVNNLPYFTLTNTTFINKYIKDMYNRLNLDNKPKIEYPELCSILVVGNYSLYDLIKNNTYVFTNNEYTSLLINYYWLFKYLLLNVSKYNNFLYINELTNVLKQVRVDNMIVLKQKEELEDIIKKL